MPADGAGVAARAPHRHSGRVSGVKVGQKVNGKCDGFLMWPPNPLTLLPSRGGAYVTSPESGLCDCLL